MFKTKHKSLILLLFTILTLITTVSFASEPVVTSEASTVPGDNAKTIESPENTPELIEENSDAVAAEEPEIHEDDLYLYGDDILMDKLVDGNVYIIGNTVSVTGQINGSLFVVAKDFSLEGAYVTNSIFLCATNANFNGACYDLYAACNKLNVTYESYIARDSRINCDEFVFHALNSRNMIVSASSIDFGSDDKVATIYGNLDYTSPTELELSEGIVSGEVQYNPSETTNAETSSDAVSIFKSIVSALVYSIVVYFVIRLFTPHFAERISTFASKKIIFAFLIGLAAIFVIPVVATLLLITQVASGLAIAILVVYALFISISFAIFSLFITKLLRKKLKKLPEFGLFAIVTVILALLRTIPYVSIIISFLLGITGFGIIIMNFFNRFNCTKKTSKISDVQNSDNN